MQQGKKQALLSVNEKCCRNQFTHFNLVRCRSNLTSVCVVFFFAWTD
jgi:hypothetical protein